MNRINECAVQLYDDPKSDRASAKYISFSTPFLRAGQFVIVECGASGRKFLGNVSGANLNFNRNSLSATDNTAVNQLEQITFGMMNREVAVKEIFFYEVLLLKEIIGGRAESVRLRPQIGALARPATEKEIVDLLGLPDIIDGNQIGWIIDTSVQICISKDILKQHLLIAGATGSGKTNTIANAVAAAINMGMCVVVFDHKPDYQHAHLKNDEPPLQNYFMALDNVEYWYVGQSLSVPGREESPVLVAANDLDPLMLSATIFHGAAEDLQAESCHFLMLAWISKCADKNEVWTMQGFRQWLRSNEIKEVSEKLNKTTFGAIQRKIELPGRIPNWIDATPSTMSSRMFKGPTKVFKADELIRSGRIVVIRVGSGTGEAREYGLLLSHVMEKISDRARAHKLPCPVAMVIDEAQDIFSASRQFKEAALGNLDRHIRKGRSLGLYYTIGVQSADAVPESIINNLNSRIIHRHNSPEQVRVAANMATDDQRRMTATFSAGEALTFLIGSNSIVHARMRRSPFKLTKEDL